MADSTRSIVLCADDYAHSSGVSEAVCQLARAGRLPATSVMALSPRWREDAAPLRELRERLDVGLHLDFASGFARAAGCGQSLGAAMRRALLGGFERAAARAAIERQLDAFEAIWQAPPDHVDGHQHVQQFAGIREPLVESLARRYGVRAPWLRVSRPPAGQAGVKGWLIARMGADALQSLAAAQGLAHSRWLTGIYDFKGGAAAYAHRMAGWLTQAPAGAVLMCHPAAASAQEGSDPISAARQWEWAYLSSPAFAEQCAAAGVRFARGSDLYGKSR
ncbi:MAG: ChbG/HpnK family deacetylase [Burkholderiaceae bacterium]|nr:ChbG/HpnK family deacetylase [Burkholderiaceae bacterium]